MNPTPPTHIDTVHSPRAGRRWRATALLLALGWVVLFASEARLPARLAAKLHPNSFPWQVPDAAALSAVQAETRRQLEALPAVPRFQPLEGARLEDAVGHWRRARPVNTWPNACLAAGVLAAAQAGGAEADFAALRRFADRCVTPAGRFREPLHGVEQAMLGPVLLELARRDAGPRYRTAALELTGFLLKQHPRTPTGTLPYSAGEKEVLLVDTLAMVCPFLAAAATNLARPEAADLAILQLTEFHERAVDALTGLPWHAYRAGGGPAYGALGWTRGCGWYAVGLAETCTALPADHPARPRLAAALEQLVQAALVRQQPDGLWRWCLSIPEGDEDTSGSALLAWAIERGCRCGALPAKYLEAAHRARAGVLRRTDQRGVVGQALGECQAVGHYPRVFGAYPWAQGPATAALAWSQAGNLPKEPAR
jgi:rhamnogalacturonyl hydrolase YesR